MIVVEI